MRPITSLPPEEAKGLSGVLFDLDDTLLDGGRLPEAAYRSLFRLKEAGLTLIAVTGRPAGWGEVLIRQWPLDGIVTENGAVACYREGGVARWDRADPATRHMRRVRLASAYQTISSEFAEARLSDDTDARQSDIAIDIGERQTVRPELVARMEARAHELGFRTMVSSVHLHLTLDSFDKASGTVAFLADRHGVDPTLARVRYAYVGDSGNDAACFFAFRTSIGVANVRASLGRISVAPRFVASGERSAGFVEIAERLVRLRGGSSGTAPTIARQ
jgi:HAD superfamily hydrolase (TIGR01484 family)